MKPRNFDLPTPDLKTSGRYWCVQIPEQGGDHHFRFPSYTMGACLVRLWQSLETPDAMSEGESDFLARMQRALEVAGPAIGLCWWHLDLELQTSGEHLHPRSSRAELMAYGDAVVSELQEAGYTERQIVALGNACSGPINGWMLEVVKAVKADRRKAEGASDTDADAPKEDDTGPFEGLAETSTSQS